MSIYDYEMGLRISAYDWPFAALIQAAMRKADTYNMQTLSKAFPDIARELKARYNAPGGLLPDEIGVCKPVEF